MMYACFLFLLGFFKFLFYVSSFCSTVVADEVIQIYFGWLLGFSMAGVCRLAVYGMIKSIWLF